jgi:hypothetical protein
MGEEFSKEIGIEKPRSFMLDASVLEEQEDNNFIRDEIKQNRVVFNFPDGLNNIDLFERCRMLFQTEDFELCYVTVMGMLEGKPVQVYLKNYDGGVSLFSEFLVTHRDQKLELIESLRENAYIVNWLIEFIVGLEEKKFPRPLLHTPPEEALVEEKKKK